MSNTEPGARREHGGMFSAFVTTHRDEIIKRTSVKMAERETSSLVPTARPSSVPGLVDEIVDAWVSDLAGDEEASERFFPPASLLRQLPLSEVVSAYRILCHVVRGLAWEMGSAGTLEEALNLDRYLDDGIARAIVELRPQPTQSSRLDQFEVERAGFRAHELRNLLNTSMLAFRTLRTQHPESENKAWTILDKSLESLTGLVARSLDEVRAHQATLDRSPLRLADLVADVTQASTLEAASKGVTLSVGSIESDVVVEVDRNVLGAVLSNLLQNAFKFTRPDTVVTLRVDTSDRRVCIHVQDECGGLPGGDVDTLFHSFEQLSPDRTGLGLGLAFCRWGAEVNNGRIYVRDIPRVGCVFTVELPRIAAEGSSSNTSPVQELCGQ